MPTSTSRSDQCSNRTEISVSARTRRSAHIRLDSRGASSRRCSYSRSTEREGAILLPFSSREHSRCRGITLQEEVAVHNMLFMCIHIHNCFNTRLLPSYTFRIHFAHTQRLSAVLPLVDTVPFLHVEASCRNFEREHPQTCFSNVIHGLNGMTLCRSGLALTS